MNKVTFVIGLIVGSLMAVSSAMADGPSTAPVCPSESEFLETMQSTDPDIMKVLTDRLWVENRDWCIQHQDKTFAELEGFTDAELLRLIFNGTHVPEPRTAIVPIPESGILLATITIMAIFLGAMRRKNKRK